MNCATDSAWHLDKKVPIVIILTMGIQVAGGLWFISKRDARCWPCRGAAMLPKLPIDKANHRRTAGWGWRGA